MNTSKIRVLLGVCVLARPCSPTLVDCVSEGCVHPRQTMAESMTCMNDLYISMCNTGLMKTEGIKLYNAVVFSISNLTNLDLFNGQKNSDSFDKSKETILLKLRVRYSTIPCHG